MVKSLQRPSVKRCVERYTAAMNGHPYLSPSTEVIHAEIIAHHHCREVAYRAEPITAEWLGQQFVNVGDRGFLIGGVHGFDRRFIAFRNVTHPYRLDGYWVLRDNEGQDVLHVRTRGDVLDLARMMKGEQS